MPHDNDTNRAPWPHLATHTVAYPLCVKHRISGFGQWVRPAEALGRQGTASWPVVPSLTPPKLRGREPPCAGQRAARARPSRRAGRPKPRHAKVQVRPCRPSLASTRSWGGKRKEHVSSPGKNRFGLGQLIRAQVRPMAGDSPSRYSLAGQSGLV